MDRVYTGFRDKNGIKIYSGDTVRQLDRGLVNYYTGVVHINKLTGIRVGTMTLYKDYEVINNK